MIIDIQSKLAKLEMENYKLKKENDKLKKENEILTNTIVFLTKKYDEIGVKIEEIKEVTRNCFIGHKVYIKYLTIPETKLAIPIMPDAISTFLNWWEVK